MNDTYAIPQTIPVSQLGANARAGFINRTYAHLFGAMALFVAIEVALFQSGMAASIAQAMLQVNWLFIIGAFMVVGWLASRVAFSARSTGAQYAALVGFVTAEALLFVPMLFVAQNVAPGAIQSAALVTMLGFSGLTFVAFVTRKDFSFLRGLLFWGMIVALVLIVASILFGFHLGTWFSVAMVGFAGIAILHDTSNVLHHYPEDRHVGAALQLFASVALMLWYVLSIFLNRD